MANRRPTDILLSAVTVAENQKGALIGTLSAVDPDPGETFTYTPLDSRFIVSGDQLYLKPTTALNFETASTASVKVRTTDAGGLTFTKILTLPVQDVNEVPTAILLSNASVAENAAGAVIGDLSALDPDAGDAATFTTADARFEIVGDTLKLRDGTKLNHEYASVAKVKVTATDRAGLATAKTLSIAVEDVNERPTGITLNGTAVAENAPGAAVGTLTVTDPDRGETFTFAVSDARFEVVGDELRLKDGVALDFEAQPSVALKVTATDHGGLKAVKAFTITVTDVDDTTPPEPVQVNDSRSASGAAGANGASSAGTPAAPSTDGADGGPAGAGEAATLNVTGDDYAGTGATDSVVLERRTFGGDGGVGGNGQAGGHGSSTTVYSTTAAGVVVAHTTWTSGGAGGDAGGGGAGGAATTRIDGVSAALGTTPSHLEFETVSFVAHATGGNGNLGGYGGPGGGSGRSGRDAFGNSETGNQGGAGGQSGNGGAGGDALASIAQAGASAEMLSINLNADAQGGQGGSGAGGGGGGSGATGGEGGHGNAGGRGGHAVAEVTSLNATATEALGGNITAVATGGWAGAGGDGSYGGQGETYSPWGSYLTYTAQGTGGAGGHGGDATARVAGNRLTEDADSQSSSGFQMQVYAEVGAGGRGGWGRPAEPGDATRDDRPGSENGAAGMDGVARVVITNNTILFGGGNDRLALSLYAYDGESGEYLSLGSTGQAVLEFSGNRFEGGDGRDVLDLGGIHGASVSVDLAAGTLSIAGLTGSTLAGFEEVRLPDGTVLIA